MSRKHIPAELKREVLVEAGHRCAIPTCRTETTELAHIEPYAKVKEHTFDNLIALCPNCHTRFDKRDIDKKSMLVYKSNLSILTNRYGELERRVLELFSSNKESNSIWLIGGLDLLLYYLLKDKIIEDTGQTGGVVISGIPSKKLYRLTDKGRTLVNDILDAKSLR